MPQVDIQPFQSRYQQAAIALINRNMQARFGVLDESLNPDLYDIASSYADGEFVLALMDEGLVVGTGALLPELSDASQVPEAAAIGRIVRMHVDPAYRRLGIASHLLTHLEQRAGLRGYRELVLETNLDWTDAITFYEASGYRETGRGPVEIHFSKPVAAD